MRPPSHLDTLEDGGGRRQQGDEPTAGGQQGPGPAPEGGTGLANFRAASGNLQCCRPAKLSKKTNTNTNNIIRGPSQPPVDKGADRTEDRDKGEGGGSGRKKL
ncbi:hypothetical protein CFIO01_11064 [Colletotrichum fioriniae PJ7]|uniref:Uncharacterized protein n=1 Tax=Colletotrichum fioriniae PJ7 TaxID=1445577 RepID=A0A010RDY1_9PEZI|nr:hypothetical protein CFIO01_11064 [Colletotrichum fioriniae PJ7]